MSEYSFPNTIFSTMNLYIEESWKKRLASEFPKEYFKELVAFVESEYQTGTIYPSKDLIFNAFNLCPFDSVEVVILGQDPYHGPNQAHGLCFSVVDGVPHPPSLVNIFKEIQNDVQVKTPQSGNLERWAKQGVFLLNATLTVKAGMAGSHQKKGWELFTDQVIKILTEEKKNLVFMLWGAYAQQKGAIISAEKHLLLQSPHPSPLSAHRGFFGNHHFSKANDYLKAHGKKAINW